MHRSWSLHTLTVTGLHVFGTGLSSRVLSSSLDRSIYLYDCSSSQYVYNKQLNVAAECMVVSVLGNIAFVGTTNGEIIVVDLTALAITLSNIHDNEAGTGTSGSDRLVGHTRKVNCLACSIDNVTLVSGSDDGSIILWDIWSRQALKQFKPFSKSAVTSIVVSYS
jgi:pre-rRNA-processing protein IPI3